MSSRLLTAVELEFLGIEVEDPLFSLISEAVEEMLEGILNYNPLYAEIEDEEVEIREDVRYGDFVIHPRSRFRVRRVPIREWTSLKTVGAIGPDGQFTGTSAISRDLYHVDFRTGLIRFSTSTTMTTGPSTVLAEEWDLLFGPSGGGLGAHKFMLATYTAGYDLTPTRRISGGAKIALLGIISRLYTQFRNEKWNLAGSSNPDGGSTQYMRVELTPEEELGLRSAFKRMSF